MIGNWNRKVNIILSKAYRDVERIYDGIKTNLISLADYIGSKNYKFKWILVFR